MKITDEARALALKALSEGREEFSKEEKSKIKEVTKSKPFDFEAEMEAKGRLIPGHGYKVPAIIENRVFRSSKIAVSSALRLEPSPSSPPPSSCARSVPGAPSFGSFCP
jgi:hypothetical protein